MIGRKNLDIISFAAVHKINFDSNKKAISVSYTKDGLDHEVKVSKEVIVSAGAVESPKILLLSGIGDRKELDQVGVDPIVAHLPSVGKSFQDQIGVVINLTMFEPRNEISYRDYRDYRKSRDGPLGKNPYIVLAFVRDELTAMDRNDTRIEYEFYLDTKTGGKSRHVSVQISLLAPRSRGYVKLKSTIQTRIRSSIQIICPINPIRKCTREESEHLYDS